jgi:thioredoxin-related protein
MRKTFIATLLALVLIAPPATSRAGLDTEAQSLSSTPLELVIIEADGCIYCKLFRRDVLPSYQSSDTGKEMPVRFVDVNEIDATKVEFKSAVDIVPTFIVVKSQHEVGRISGYMGSEDFFHSISYLLDAAP